MKLVLLVAFIAAQCTQGTPKPGPPAPTPTVIVTAPPPAPPADAGASTCLTAYARMFALSCPPAEDAHFGWVENDCKRCTAKQIDDISNAQSCRDTRQGC